MDLMRTFFIDKPARSPKYVEPGADTGADPAIARNARKMISLLLFYYKLLNF